MGNQVLVMLDIADLESNNDAMAALTKNLQDAMKDPSDLQNKLNAIVHSVALANTAVQAITDALKAAGKLVA